MEKSANFSDSGASSKKFKSTVAGHCEGNENAGQGENDRPRSEGQNSPLGEALLLLASQLDLLQQAPDLVDVRVLGGMNQPAMDLVKFGQPSGSAGISDRPDEAHHPPQ